MDYGRPPNSTPEAHHAHKRCRQNPTDDQLTISLATVSQSRVELQNAKPRLTNTHKLRMMKEIVVALEYELQVLQSKWTAQIPDDRTRVTAQRCAYEKYAAKQSDEAHRELQKLFQQQQFLLASLQTAVLRNSLTSNGHDILKELHFGTRLGRNPDEREWMLVEHNRRSTATVPSTVEKLSQLAIDKALAEQKKSGQAGKLMLPLSQIDITGCEDGTLVSSVFVSEIPHPSLERVYAAAMAHFDSIPAWMKHHFGIEASVRRLNSADSPVAYSQLKLGGAGLPATMNHVVCSSLTAHSGMIYLDAITEDPLHPVPADNPLQFGICALTITPNSEPNAGVTLRWVVLYRYNLMPDDPALKSDLELSRPILNGDLITSAICSYLQEQQSPQVQSSA